MATSNTAIKITQLPNIGNAIAPSTLIPVVNMAGLPTTQKANIQITGNLILAGAGTANFVPAALANLAYTVVNSNQSNITRVGTLNVNTLKVSGGTNGQYMQTDGTGNLAWVSGGGSGNGVVGGSNTQIQFNNAGNFGGDTGLTWNSSTGTLSTLKLSVSSDATIYGNTALTNLNVAGNFTTNNIFTDNYFYANGDPFSGNGGGGSGSKISNGTSNVNIATANGNVTVGVNGSTWTFDNTGNLLTPGNLVGPSGANLTIFANAGVHEFTFANDGTFYAPDNVVLGGTRVSIGPGANVLPGLADAILVASSTSDAFVQGVITNVSDIGSADWVAQGHRGDDDGGWTDMGFNSSGFSDPADTISGQGDGYLFVQSFYDGQAPGGRGGNLVLATGENGTVNDIVFATGGFTSSNEFSRISNANNSFELTRTGASITFPDGTIQTTAYTGGVGSELVNGDNSFVLDGDGNVVFEGAVPGQGVDRGLVWDYGSNVGGVNSQVRQDNNGITVRAWTESGGMGGPYAAPVNIVTNQDANTNTWIFNGNGNLILPGNLIFTAGNIKSNTITPAFNSAITGITTGQPNVYVTIADFVFEGPYQGEVTISGVTGTTEAIGVWGYEATEINEFQLYTDATLTTPVDGTTWTAYVSGGTAVGVGTYSDLTVQGGNVVINTGINNWTFDINGDLSAPGDIITGIDDGNGNAGRFIQDCATGTTSMRWINVLLNNGSTQLIRAYTGDPKLTGAVERAKVQLNWGDTGNLSGLSLVSFDNTDPDNAIERVWEFQGDGTLTLPPTGIIVEPTTQNLLNLNRAGTVHLRTFGPNDIQLSTDWDGNGGSWFFDSTGNLTLPGGGSVYSERFTPSGAPGNTIILNPHGSGSITNQKLMLYPTAGDGDHLHMSTGNLYQTELFLGSDDFYVKLANTGNVVINSNDSVGNSATWTFGANGNLSIPGNLNYGGSASPAPSINGFNSANFAGNVVAGNLLLNNGVIQGGVATVVTDGINSIALALGAQMDVYGFPFSQTTRGHLTISDVATPAEVNGTWYYQSTSTNAYQIYTDSTYSTLVDATGWSAYTGGGNVAITKNVPAANIVIDSNGFLTTFDNTGNLTAPSTITAHGLLVTPPVPYANLTAIAGGRAFINNGNLVAVGNFGSQVIGGGANIVPVWSDGTNWYIG